MEWIAAVERAQVMGQEPWPLAVNEIEQARWSGRDVADLDQRLVHTPRADEAALDSLYTAAVTAPRLPGSDPFEASGWAEIRAELPGPRPLAEVDPVRLPDQLAGAWVGRVVGNLMGKPVEKGWDRSRLKSYLEANSAYPLRDYVPLTDENAASAFGFQSWHRQTRGRVDGGVRDDDVDFTVLGLLLLEQHGATFTTADVASLWLHRIPVYQLYTAERAAYTNLVREIPLEEVGSHHNPYREWIGAQIRADIFGYCCPGRPRDAAQLAHRDAWLSHRSNGIYGALWAASLISAAFVARDAEESIEIALENVPPTSRLAAEVRLILDQYRSGFDWEDCLHDFDRRWDGMSWVHTLNNTGALTAALLWGGGDYATTVGLAVQAGLDTDSVGATAGSWAGAHLGLSALPDHLVAPLHDRTETGVFGHPVVRLSELAARTRAVADAIASPPKEDQCRLDPVRY